MLGVLFNQTGLMQPVATGPLWAAVLNTLRLLAAATTPLITIIIGYEVSLQRTRLLQVAVMTVFVLPPSFSIPIFMSNANRDDQAYIVNTLSLATLVTLEHFTLVSVLDAV